MSNQSTEDQMQLWDFGSSQTPDATPADTEQSFLFSMPEPSGGKILKPSFARQRPLQLLVTDDNEINRKIIRVILEKLGYSCLEAENGKDAIAQYREHKPNCIFMDLDMPEMCGIEAAKTIREIEASGANPHEKAEIIAVTANISDETRRACRRAGMNGFLEKPATTQMIKDQLLRSWPRIRARREKRCEIGLA